jgi:predicted GH43/DUF377 family glycosyl hydrolase
MVSMISNILQHIRKWLCYFFQPRLRHYNRTIIGIARYDNQIYFFIKERNHIYLVSDTTTYTYHHRIQFPKKIQQSITSMKHIDAIRLRDNSYALVVSLVYRGKSMTAYLASHDGKKFHLQSMIHAPTMGPSKLIERDNEGVTMLTSIDGVIYYRTIEEQGRVVNYYRTELAPRSDSFDHNPLHVVGVFTIPEGVFVVYDTSHELRGLKRYCFGAALLDTDNLEHCIWRAAPDEVPFWSRHSNKSNGDVIAITLGLYHSKGVITTYFYDQEHNDVYTLLLDEPYSRKEPHPHKALLKKYINNPVLKPQEHNSWENHTTFNPSAIHLDDTVHLLYRAEGSAGLSVIGYASSREGTSFTRHPDPIYVPRMNFEGVNCPDDIRLRYTMGSFKSGYNHYDATFDTEKYTWHGVEDPRITELGERIYMTYAAYNGYQQARPAITSISRDDFVNHRWNWRSPQPMTDVPRCHGDGNKNVVLHPEKVNGKYLIYHRIWPHIRIDYVDDLEFGPGKKYLKEIDRIEARGDSWDSHKIAVAAAPLRIDEGWLIIYQGAGSSDRRYKIGAMIVDYDDPSKVLYRSTYPIMTPSQWYENEHKSGVAYPCGAIVKDGQLYVYYGGSDKYVCIAHADLSTFIDKLKDDPYTEKTLIKHKNINELCI